MIESTRWIRGAFRLMIAIFLSAMPWSRIQAEEDAFPHNVLFSLKLTFQDADSKLTAEAQQIARDVAARFEKLTQRHLGNVEIRVAFVEKLKVGGANHSFMGRIQGVAFQDGETHVVQILARHTSSWGRILAHELSHVYVQVAYGQAQNRILNEGLAEYLAAELFSSEVSKDFQNASRGTAALALKPYAEGFRFVAQRASHPRFPSFFESEINGTKTSYRELAEAWKKATESPMEKDGSP